MLVAATRLMWKWIRRDLVVLITAATVRSPTLYYAHHPPLYKATCLMIDSVHAKERSKAKSLETKAAEISPKLYIVFFSPIKAKLNSLFIELQREKVMCLMWCVPFF